MDSDFYVLFCGFVFFASYDTFRVYYGTVTSLVQLFIYGASRPAATCTSFLLFGMAFHSYLFFAFVFCVRVRGACPPTSALFQTTRASMHRHSPAGWVFGKPQVSKCAYFSSRVGGCPFSGAPLLTLLNFMRRGSAAGWYPAQCTDFFSVRMLLPFLVPLFCLVPRVPCTKIQPLAGILQCTYSPV